MNNDLISRKALLERIEKDAPWWWQNFHSYLIVDMLKEAPVIEAEPVRHGHWDDSFDGITLYCSVCGMSHNCINRTPDYCPHCGAKMEGGANDGQNPQMEDETD